MARGSGPQRCSRGLEVLERCTALEVYCTIGALYYRCTVLEVYCTRGVLYYRCTVLEVYFTRGALY